MDSNSNNNDNTAASYPSPDEINPFHQQPNPFTEASQPHHHHQQPTTSPDSSKTTPPPPPPPVQASSSTTKNDDDVASCSEKWGTHVMGHPAVPTCHPANKKAAQWGAPPEEARTFHYPYMQYSPVEKSSSTNTNTAPAHSMLHAFNSWSNKAESLAHNIWHNLKTGPSVSGAAWAKVNVTAKAITGGGFEPLYKQTFATYPNEKLKKTFACYLSTSTGPVPGTLYLSNVHVAFCSDRPLSFTAPSGQQSWSYYKVMVPLPNIGTVNPVVMRESPTEKYIQIVTIDGNDFWFMGFVNYDKASKHLTESISTFVAPGYAAAVPPPAVEKHTH